MKRVLIANRGEIALRIIRACHEEGLEAVAVYSSVDRAAPHVRAADHAVAIGPAAQAQSYLSIDRLIEAARKTNTSGHGRSGSPPYKPLPANPQEYRRRGRFGWRTA